MNSAIFKLLWSNMASPGEHKPELGFSALGLVLRYYGLPDITDVLGDLALRELGLDVHVSTSLDTMERLARRLGLAARCSDEPRLDQAALPAIVQDQQGRFMVVCGQEEGEVLVLNPATGLVRMSEHQFLVSWQGAALSISVTPDALSPAKVEELAQGLRAVCHRRDLVREFNAVAVAQGSFGLIYRGARSDGTPVSIKALPSQGVGGQRVQRFMREVAMLKRLHRLDLPGLVRILEIRQEELCYIMEWADGGSLEELAWPLDTGRAVNLFVQVAAALQNLHEHGLVHRDLSAGNILLFHGDVAKLSDFGFMFALDSAAGTVFPRGAGTYNYLSPEQATGAPLDEKTDIYSLGVIMYEALAGASPFANTGIPARYKRPPRQPPSFVPHLLAEITAGCLEREASRRPSAAEVVQALNSIFG